MMDQAYMSKVRELCGIVTERIEKVHIGYFHGVDKPVFLISETYPGLWMEHVYDAICYAGIKPQFIPLAENTVNLFMDRQTSEGQLPFAVMRDGTTRYAQIQECVSFYTLCLQVYGMNQDRAFLQKAYDSGVRWDGWLRRYRMTTGRGLVEMFVGYDTGHDNSGRLEGMACPGNYEIDGVEQNAAVLPPDDGVTPILAVDMNANLFGNEMALSEMARLLGKADESTAWRQSAERIKQKLFKHCYNDADGFFYDVDRNGHQRKYKSSTIFHLFMERVLDPVQDADLIGRIYHEHIKNPQEFWTPYPFPSMAVNDPSCAHHITNNCWGYYTMGLIVLRCSRWMDAYGWSEDYDHVCRQWLSAWTAQYDQVPFGQELDPITGQATQCSPWYSSGMLSYLLAARRLGIIEL